MAALPPYELPISAEQDVVRVRQVAREWAVDLGFSLVEQTKIVTAASELARNTLIHGGGGSVRLEEAVAGGRHGLRLTFEDRGPGIADLQLALKDGYTTGTGFGLGLPGSKRLMNEFQIVSNVGEGTTVSVVRWR
jgi:serine/threonine-protein kinase RsbT